MANPDKNHDKKPVTEPLEPGDVYHEVMLSEFPDDIFDVSFKNALEPIDEPISLAICMLSFVPDERQKPCAQERFHLPHLHAPPEINEGLLRAAAAKDKVEFYKVGGSIVPSMLLCTGRAPATEDFWPQRIMCGRAPADVMEMSYLIDEACKIEKGPRIGHKRRACGFVWPLRTALRTDNPAS